jgi:hypothetical protein
MPTSQAVYPKTAHTYFTEQDYADLVALAKKDRRPLASYMRCVLTDHIRSLKDARPNQARSGQTR